MISQLAKEDLDDLRAEGLTPSDEDVIRLHALALKISDGPETTAYNAPRFAVAGGHVFWEPTMAALFWYAYAKRYADDEATEDWLFAFACAHGRERGYLDGLRDPEEIQCALGHFIGGCTATKSEVVNAVYFVSVGVEKVEPEKTDIAKEREKHETTDERVRRNFAALEERLAEAAAATGLTFDDLMIQTPSRLRGMIYAAHVQAGMEMSKTSAKAHADYLATLNAITKRLRAEKAEKEAAAPSPPES
ncbi:MAG: hypothetical protein IKP97_00545 [Kiritimatiellae bacterium]|nr:hypothetical protein [Kiritimatiellia bacterium]